MNGLARLIYRRARLVLVLSCLAVAIGVLAGSTAIPKLKAGGFDDPGSESIRGSDLLARQFGIHEPTLIFVVSARERGVDSFEVADEGRRLTANLEQEPNVQVLGSYWSPGPAQAKLRSRDGTKALIITGLDGDADTRVHRTNELAEKYRGGTYTEVRTGGFEQINSDLLRQSTDDLITSEAIAVPIIAVLLVLAFGSLIAAALPLLVAVVAIIGAFASLAMFALFTDVSIYAQNLTTALALGLGIDYSLLLVSRYREERAVTGDSAETMVRTLATAGRTVLYSALTVALGLAALAVFPLYFLRSFAYAGVAVVLVAAVTSVLMLPALLVVLGPRLERFTVRRTGRARAVSTAIGFWYRLARLTMRKPVLTALPVVLVLLFLGAHFLSASYSYPSDRVLSEDDPGRQADETVRNDFPADVASPMSITLPMPGLDSASVGRYAAAVSRLPGVSAVQSAGGIFGFGQLIAPGDPGQCNPTGCYLIASSTTDPYNFSGEELVKQVRALPAPAPALVGGDAARGVDIKAAIVDRLPLVIGIVLLSSLILLFLFTGSVVMPVKASVLNLMTLAAVMGLLVWIFQDGYGAALLGFTPTPVAVTMPPLMFCVVFALSMDYEVFLLARIKEKRDSGMSNQDAIAAGLGSSGRIISTAAALLSVALFVLVAAEISFVKWFALGTGLAIVIDATVVRGIVVPAFLRLAGEASWWSPTVLRRIHDRFGIGEGNGKENDKQVVHVGVGDRGASGQDL